MPESLELIGETFPAALALARVARVLVTRPPRAGLGIGPLRVVAVRDLGTEAGVCLVLSYQSYRRLPRGSQARVDERAPRAASD